MTEHPSNKEHATGTGLILNMRPCTDEGEMLPVTVGGKDITVVIRAEMVGQSVMLDIDTTGPPTPVELMDFMDMIHHVLRHASEEEDKASWDLFDCQPSDITSVIDHDGGEWELGQRGWCLKGFPAGTTIKWDELVRRYGPVTKIGA